jgi:hypothetical protein
VAKVCRVLQAISPDSSTPRGCWSLRPCSAEEWADIVSGQRRGVCHGIGIELACARLTKGVCTRADGTASCQQTLSRNEDESAGQGGCSSPMVLRERRSNWCAVSLFVCAKSLSSAAGSWQFSAVFFDSLARLVLCCVVLSGCGDR